MTWQIRDTILIDGTVYHARTNLRTLYRDLIKIDFPTGTRSDCWDGHVLHFEQRPAPATNKLLFLKWVQALVALDKATKFRGSYPKVLPESIWARTGCQIGQPEDWTGYPCDTPVGHLRGITLEVVRQGDGKPFLLYFDNSGSATIRDPWEP